MTGPTPAGHRPHPTGAAAPAPADPGGDEVLTVRLPGGTVAVPARCPHRGAPLRDGTLVGSFLECPWHGATFDLRTGRRLRGPACADLAILGTAPQPDPPDRPSGMGSSGTGSSTGTGGTGEETTA